MGNAGSAAPAAGIPGASHDSREVVLAVHSVHNVHHTDKESYYGMATNHTAEVEIPVTSEKPAKMTVGIESIVSVRIFLHARGMPSSSDRAIGQLSIPIQEMLDICGPGIYQTWLLLDPWTAYGSQSRSQVAERFRRALMEIPAELHSPRICLTLLEASVDPAQWAVVEKDRAFYHDPLLVSHAQHAQTVKAYFDHCDREELSQSRRGSRRASTNSGAIEAAQLHAELEKLAQKQKADEAAQLRSELDHITEEANRRIEQGNENILKLKANLRQLRDVEEPLLEKERLEAAARLQTARQKASELQRRAEGQLSVGSNAELEKLREEAVLLRAEKAALMAEVQEIYSSQKSATASAGRQQPRVGGSSQVEDRLLPDPREILGTSSRGPL